MTNGDDAPRGDFGRYALKVGGGWGLLELSDFGREYVQIYSVLHVLNEKVHDSMSDFVPTMHKKPGDEDEEDTEDDQITRSSQAPWRGGWSAVNFLKSAVRSVPREHAPQVAKLAYASPGAIDLKLLLPIAEEISRTVDIVAGAGSVANAYNTLYREARARKLLDRDARESRLSRGDATFAMATSRDMLVLMDLGRYGTKIANLTKDNPLATMKIVFSLYRRISTLAKLQAAGKVRF